MAKDYNAFIAGEVLSGEQMVTYRLVARAMKVHANEAKRMLYEFHRCENAKRAGSVHATYLLSGMKKVNSGLDRNTQKSDPDGDDIMMRSSPAPASSMVQDANEEPDLRRVLTLVREEQLLDARQQYAKLTGIHVYSLQPSSIKNLEALTSVNERIFQEYGQEDLLVKGKTYGLIHNPHAKRRSGARAPLPAPSTNTTSSTASKPKLTAKASSSSLSQTTASKNAKPTKAEPSSSTAASSAKPPALKKETSSIFKAFGKSKTKPAATTTTTTTTPSSRNDDDNIKVTPGGPVTDSSAHGAHSMAVSSLGNETEVKQDVEMAEDDDDEDEDDFVAPKAGSARGRKNKAERDEELRRKMFEDDDEDEQMPDAPAKKEPPGENEEEDVEEDEDEADQEPEPEPEPEEDSEMAEAAASVKEEEEDEEAAEQVTVSNGRRRGRRRIVRKKMIKDAEGYLVSREEPGWESFSEEDVPLPAAKKAAVPASSAPGKKGQVAKKGQGTIMSFFGKK